MISAGDFRNGLTFEINGQPHIIVEFQHVKPGKGAAFVRTKYKNLITGAIREESLTQQLNSPQHVLTEQKCSICTTTAKFTT